MSLRFLLVFLTGCCFCISGYAQDWVAISRFQGDFALRTTLPISCRIGKLYKKLGIDQNPPKKDSPDIVTLPNILDTDGKEVKIFITAEDTSRNRFLRIYDRQALAEFNLKYLTQPSIRDCFSFWQGQLDYLDWLTIRQIEVGKIPDYENPEGKANPHDWTFVPQHWEIRSKKPLATGAVGPCIVFLVLNLESGEQFLGHVDSNTILRGDIAQAWKKSKAVLFGGDPDSMDLATDVVLYLHRQGVFDIFKTKFLEPTTEEGGKHIVSTVVGGSAPYALHLDLDTVVPIENQYFHNEEGSTPLILRFY